MTERPEALDAIALMRATIRGDDEAIGCLLATLGAEPVAALMTGIALQLGAEMAGSVEEFDRLLAERQAATTT
ncbi:MAG TPA: hypothetical protein VI011_17835 [Asanoa sp.]